MTDLMIELSDRNRIAGRRFGRLTVSEQTSQTTDGRDILWRCLCDCGGEKLTTRWELSRGNIRSCGCLRRQSELSNLQLVFDRNKAKDLTGRRIGLLEVIRKAHKARDGRWLYECVCKCGAARLASRSDLLPSERKYPASCGCKGKGFVEMSANDDGSMKCRLISTQQIIPLGLWKDENIT